MWFNSTNYSINNHSLWFNSKDYSIQNNTLWFNSIHSPFVDFGPLIGPYLVSIFVQVPNFSILGPLEPWEQFSSWCRINHKGHIIVYFPQIWLQVWLRLLSSFWSPLHVGAVPVWNPRLGLKVLNFRKFDLKILILVIKFSNIMKGLVILITNVPWFKEIVSIHTLTLPLEKIKS